jgi:hypothetical protein
MSQYESPGPQFDRPGSQYYDESLIEHENPPRQRGCFFYGCLFAIILTLLAVVGGGIAVFMLYRYAVNTALPYTDTAPTPLPKVEMPPEEAKELHARVDAFREALDSGKPSEPLVLDSDDINVLIADNPDLRDKVHVDVEGDKVNGQVSFPLEGIGLPAFKGRYLNGKATLKVSLEDGFLRVTLDALEVKGKPVPANFIDQLRSKNLAEDVARNPENAEAIRKLESIKVVDGKVILKARARDGGEAEEGNREEDAKAEDTLPDANDKGKAKDEATSDDGFFGEEDAKGPELPKQARGPD